MLLLWEVSKVNRSYSLKRHKEFRYTYRAGRSTGARLFTLVVAKNREQAVRVGFSVSKRVGNSVQRNRAKRRLRACLTPMLPKLRKGVNVIFIARRDVLTEPFSSMQEQMRDILQRAGVWVTE